MTVLIAITTTLCAAAILGGTLWIVRIVQTNLIKRSLQLRLLSIQLPQASLGGEAAKQQKNFKEEINISEQLLGILAGSTQGATLEAAVHHVGDQIHFYVSVPEKFVPFVSRQIEGLFKDARVEEAQEYNIFQPEGYTEALYLKQDTYYALPLRTYTESDSDTFSPILSTLSKIQEIGEGIAVQVIIQPIDSSYKKNILTALRNLKKGGKFEDAIGGNIKLKDFLGGTPTSPEGKEKEESVDQEAIKMIEQKLSKPLVLANYRILISATTQMQVDALRESITGSFRQFEAPLRNKLKIVRVKNTHHIAYQFSFRQFDAHQTIILNTEELVSMFHLPTSSTLASKIKWMRSKEAAPPAELPHEGVRIGESAYRGDLKPVYITDEDRRRHIYVIGQTGTGKSALMTNMVVDDIKRGKGVCIIDPHGDLVDSILGSMPKERADDVIVFDPGFLQKPIGLNMLEYDATRPEEKTFIVNEIQGIFNKLFTAETMGPMFEQYMRNALLLLMEDATNEPATLIEVPRIFTDDDFRRRKLARITNPVVLDFWQKEAVKVGGEASLANMAPYITSKFNNFIANDYVRPIIGQTTSSFNFRKVMDEQKILLVSLSKGRIGELNAGLLGMIIVGKLLLSAFARVDTPQEQRKDFNLYIDEFQNFTTDSIATILSEARKYRLNLTIAHQFIAQLQEKIRDSVFGNVGSMVTFRVGAQDAEFLIKQYDTVFSQNDLINIDNLNAYVKLLINGQTSQPFNIRTPMYPPQDHLQAQQIKELASLKYGANRSTVEANILQRLRS